MASARFVAAHLQVTACVVAALIAVPVVAEDSAESFLAGDRVCTPIRGDADLTDTIIAALGVAGAGILLVAESKGKPLAVEVAKGLGFVSSAATLARKVQS